LRSLYRPLLELRERGWIRHLGVSVAAVGDAWLTLERPEVEVVQLPYNLALSEADQGLLQRLHDAGKGVLIREALGNGLLTGKYGARTRFSSADFRSAWRPEMLRAALAAAAAWEPYRRPGESQIHFALRFVLDRPEVSAVLVGARNPAQIEALAAAGGIAAAPMEHGYAARPLS
jgi:aryl-alcohol dehydrogenase-like predicted oxidoreductase